MAEEDRFVTSMNGGPLEGPFTYEQAKGHALSMLDALERGDFAASSVQVIVTKLNAPLAAG